MTDLEKFVQLYKEFGIDCKVNIIEDRQIIYLRDGAGPYEVTRNDKLTGYSGFSCEVCFDMSGKFIEQGFWE